VSSLRKGGSPPPSITIAKTEADQHREKGRKKKELLSQRKWGRGGKRDFLAHNPIRRKKGGKRISRSPDETRRKKRRRGEPFFSGKKKGRLGGESEPPNVRQRVVGKKGGRSSFQRKRGERKVALVYSFHGRTEVDHSTEGEKGKKEKILNWLIRRRGGKRKDRLSLSNWRRALRNRKKRRGERAPPVSAPATEREGERKS